MSDDIDTVWLFEHQQEKLRGLPGSPLVLVYCEGCWYGTRVEDLVIDDAEDIRTAAEEQQAWRVDIEAVIDALGHDLDDGRILAAEGPHDFVWLSSSEDTSPAGYIVSYLEGDGEWKQFT